MARNLSLQRGFFPAIASKTKNVTDIIQKKRDGQK